MIHVMMNAKGLYKTSSRSNTPVTTRGCSRVITNLVSEHKVENNIGFMSQNTTSSRVLFMGVKRATLMNERLRDA